LWLIFVKPTFASFLGGSDAILGVYTRICIYIQHDKRFESVHRGYDNRRKNVIGTTPTEEAPGQTSEDWKERRGGTSHAVAQLLDDAYADVVDSGAGEVIGTTVGKRVLKDALTSHSYQRYQQDTPLNTNHTDYGTDHYLRVVSQRAHHILGVLLKKQSVIYSDLDTVWLQDPTKYLTGDYDLWGQEETLIARKVYPPVPYYCTGLIAVR
jgi:hypothetical protein